ncbi:DUF2156 domain-containing protein [Lutispora thermophila]|uniref:Phosphatidylglycerol lysyltransferase C-terminal domain-containing protein n=1 Tax=Lutispora thermophila DSM 19022 TaxID=1122184 RepID=A0A1M6EX00_9FIRM|nr:phosphatidylglycerol lysyltransferase domain-containing protein [Lutispora thermophila]SHI89936.1 hypothetical protein SAMN02745176_01747 [Lutispora thermophila DSM 19022]
MLQFKTLELSDRELFMKYLGDYNFNTYEYSFLNLYLWREYCNVEYAILNDALIIKKTEEGKGTVFMQPIGYTKGNLKDIISELIEYKKSNSSMKVLFSDIEEPFLEELKKIYDEKLQYFQDVKNFDYIYETEKLIKLNGDKLRKRKSQYNHFVSSYQYSIKDISEDKVINDCIRFAEEWFSGQQSNHQLVCELKGIKDIMHNLKLLNGLGMAVYVNDVIAGFTIGEIVNKNMAIIHIEKGDTIYNGIYAFINRTFAELYLKDVKHINREEDIGIPGLRRAKLAYDPIKLEKKYLVDIRRD